MLGNHRFRAALLGLFLFWLLVVGIARAAPAPGRLTPPAALAAPASTATIVLNPIADSYVVLSSTSNFGVANDVHVDYDSGSHTFSRALIQFSMADLAYQLPEGATVLTATLKLHLSVDAPVTETLTVHTGSGADWGEDTVNWNSQPSWGPPGVALSVSPGQGDRVWDITPLLQGWLNGSLSNHGLGLLGPESGLDSYSFIFDSRTGANPPQLEITYQLPPPTAPPPTEIAIPPHPAVVTRPVLALSNDTAAAGSQVRATGFDFPSGLCSRYDTFVMQNPLTPTAGLTPTITLVGSTEPSEGDFATLVFTVPVSAKGNYNVVTLGGGHQATTHLVVTPTVVLAGPEAPAAPGTAALSASPASGGPGTRVTVTGSGFTGAGCSPVNFMWQQNLSSDASYLISLGAGQLSGGAVSYSFNVPAVRSGPAILWAVGPNNTYATAAFTVISPPPPPPPPPNPVTVSMCAAADTYVDSNPAAATSGNYLNVGHFYNSVQVVDYNKLSLVRFDLSSLPVGATVNQASLALNLQSGSGLSSVQIGAFELNALWSESNFTWEQLDNLSPYATRELSRQSVDKTAGATFTWDVTAAAQDWVDSPGANYGLILDDMGGAVGPGQDYNRAFFGREYGSGTCPQLTLTYDPATAGNDLYVGGVDLVQATGRPVFLPYARTAQTVNAGAALIAGKSTLLRVFPGTASQLSQVTGSVTGYPCGSGSALSGSPLTPVDGPIAAMPNPNPAYRLAALNFVLPGSWLSGCIDLSMTLTSVGEPEGASKLANNTARWNSINFQSTQTLNLVLVPLWDRNSGLWVDATTPQYVGPILAWLNAVYPLADGNIRYWYTSLQPYDQTLPGDGSDLIDDLEPTRDYILDNVPSIPANTRFLGLAPGNFGGMARRGGRTSPTAGNVAWASTSPAGPTNSSDPEFYGAVWAQEIAHLFGRMHASDAHGESSGGAVDCQFPSYGAYFNHGGIGSYGVAFNTDTWYPAATPYQPNNFLPPGSASYHGHDFMSYGGFPRWTSPYTFDALARALNYLSPLTGRSDCSNSLAATAVAAPTAPVLPAEPATTVDLIRISGKIRPDHSVTWHASFHSQGADPALGTLGDYSLELRDGSNNVLKTDYFDGEHSTHSDTASVAFSELLPWLPSTARIVLKHHDYVLAEQSVSANAPTVTVLAPTGGQSVGSQLTVRWQSNDLDGGLLTYAVVYTGTNGEWWPIVTGLTATAGLPVSYTVATNLLAGSGQAHVKVLVSDGIHSGESNSAAFSLPKKAPTVAILYPPDNSQWAPSGDQALLGAGYDAEDGSLSGAGLVWKSDRDGVLGQGSHLHVHLSPGTHHLTLTATDSDGQQATASVTVSVFYRSDLPVVTR